MKRTTRAVLLSVVCAAFASSCDGGFVWAQEAESVEKPAVEAGSKTPPAPESATPMTPTETMLDAIGIRRGAGAQHITTEDPLRGWGAFANWRELVDLLLALVMAAVLAASIAYHPRSYGKATSLSELESPKTFLLYAVVGALVAIVVGGNEFLGLVIFGIGGLLRFRTDVGAAKDTGRVILVTIVGLACGLQYFAPAVIATVFGWVLILILESRPAFKITVKGLVIMDGERQENRVTPSLEAYRKLLEALDCNVIRERKNFIKGQFTFVFRAPPGLTPEDLEDRARDDVPEELRGGVDWSST